MAAAKPTVRPSEKLLPLVGTSGGVTPAGTTAASIPAFQPADKEILHVAIHDLRNPLSGVLAATQFLINDAAPALNRDQIEVLRSVESSVHSILSLLDDLHVITRLASEEIRLELHPADIGLLVEHVVAVNRPLAENRRVKIDLASPLRAAVIAADAVKLGRVLELLLSNAIRVSRPGAGIELRVGAERDSVSVTLRHNAPASPGSPDGAAWTVPQSPVPKRNLSEDRFALFAAPVQKIVDAHGGTVRFEGDATKGFSVMLRLPAFRTQPYAGSAMPKKAQARQNFTR